MTKIVPDEQQMLSLLAERHRNKGKALPRWVYAEQVPLHDAVAGSRRIDAISIDGHLVPLTERQPINTAYGLTEKKVWRTAPPHDVHGFEIKVSRADWLTEHRTQGAKSAPWRVYCSHFWVVVPDASIIKPGELPTGWGLLVGTKQLRVHTPATRTIRESLPEELFLTISRYSQRVNAPDDSPSR